MQDLLRRLAQIQAAASSAPWAWTYVFNGGGAATGFFKIPQHNNGADVEMLAGDAEACAELRNLLPLILMALSPGAVLSPSELNFIADALEERAKTGDPDDFAQSLSLAERLRACANPPDQDDLAARLHSGTDG